MSDITATLSFETVVKDRDATVRITDDNLIYAVDLVMVVTGKNRDNAGWVLRNISDETFPSVKFINRKTPGKGNAKTKLISFKDAIELIMVLPGQTAKEVRCRMVDIIQRYVEGDESMHAELVNNKVQGVHKACASLFKSVISKSPKHTTPKTKYIYATYSDAFEGQVKIGRSKNVKARISSGNTMCAPKPHKIIAIAPTLDAKRDEAIAHAHFAQFRTQGEFFAISQSDAASFLANHIAPTYHLELNEMFRGSIINDF